MKYQSYNGCEPPVLNFEKTRFKVYSSEKLQK